MSRHRPWDALEFLASLIVLGAVLVATSGALLALDRSAAATERQVAAAAFQSQLHDDLHALPWDDAVLYHDEAAAVLTRVGVVEDEHGLRFESATVVTTPPEGCPPEDCPTDALPRATEQLTVGDVDYEVYRVISFPRRPGTELGAIKRFTTFVRWRAGDRVHEERLDSERAPTPDELAGG